MEMLADIIQTMDEQSLKNVLILIRCHISDYEDLENIPKSFLESLNERSMGIIEDFELGILVNNFIQLYEE